MAGGEEAGEEVEGDDGGPQEAGRAEEGVLRTHSEFSTLSLDSKPMTCLPLVKSGYSSNRLIK